MKGLFQSENFMGLLLSVFALAVYVRTLAPTVTFIDSGELAAVSYTLGIAHPTGYPLFTLLGWLFAHIPLGLRTIVQLNLMAALLCSVAIFFFFHLLVFLLSDFETTGAGKTKPREEDRDPRKERLFTPTYVGAIVGTLVLAFSETFWSQAVSLEVYSLHVVFLSLVTLLFLKAIHERAISASTSKELPPSPLMWYSFSFFLGLSFTNHMTTILLAPGFLYLFFVTHGNSKESWRKVFAAALPFLAGLSVYLYFPVRAAQGPLMNWGNPATLEKFWWHFTGKQYRVWIFSSFESAEKQFSYFVQSYPAEFSYVPLVLALIGVLFLFRTERRIFYFTLILFVSCVAYSTNYDIHDIDSYFLLAYFVTALWVAFGAKAVLDFAGRARKLNLGVVACFVAASMPLYNHYESADESQNFAVEDYTKNMFDSLEKDAVVLSYQWDYFVSASYYYQLVEGIRNDVVVVDKELLRRSWYFKQLEHQYPWLIQNSKKEVDVFLSELHKFEHGLPYDPSGIQARFEGMIHSLLAKSSESRPVYVTPEIEPEFVRGFQKIPSGLAFRLSRDTALSTISPKEFTFRPLRKNDPFTEMIRTMYARSYLNQGIYFGMLGDQTRARTFFQKALEIKPDFSEASIWMQRFGAVR